MRHRECWTCLPSTVAIAKMRIGWDCEFFGRYSSKITPSIFSQESQCLQCPDQESRCFFLKVKKAARLFAEGLMATWLRGMYNSKRNLACALTYDEAYLVPQRRQNLCTVRTVQATQHVAQDFVVVSSMLNNMQHCFREKEKKKPQRWQFGWASDSLWELMVRVLVHRPSRVYTNLL